MIHLRNPSILTSTTTTTSNPNPPQSPPSLPFLTGTWSITHSTLPMWRKNRNVRITYTPVLAVSYSPRPIDDLVTYQSLKSTAIKSVHGVDKPIYQGASANKGEGKDKVEGVVKGGDDEVQSGNWAYHWRGKGWLMIASSKWEVLGYGEEEGTGTDGGQGNTWMVTYFAKTMFTPAGIDFYSKKGKLRPETIEGIKTALAAQGGEVAKLASEVFEIVMDDERKD